MRCPNCRREMDYSVGEHHYTECGLENVYLRDVEIWRCPCGEEVVSIPAMPELHRLIAQWLIRKQDLLTGAEIRFLRKSMGLPAKEFAAVVGVEPSTVSRWENGKQSPDRANDRLIRLLYAQSTGLVSSDLIKDFPHLGSRQEPAPPVHIPRELWYTKRDKPTAT